MEDLNDKMTGGEVSADEFNQVPSEIQNAIESAGITLSSGDLEQFVKAVAHYAANSTFYTDSGSSTAYVLTPIGTNFSPPAYVDGLKVEFEIGNTNTDTATIDVDGLGAITITDSDTVGLLVAGTIVRFRYSDSTAEFVRVSSSVSQGNLVAGDALPSSDSDILARGYTSGLGILKFPTATTGTTYSGVTLPAGVDQAANVSINSANGDIWVADLEGGTGSVYKSEDDGATFVDTGSYPGSNPASIHVNKSTGDVWVGQSDIDPDDFKIYKLTGGEGTFAEVGDYQGGGGGSPRGITVNYNTGDVYIADSSGVVWKLPDGGTTYLPWGDTSAVSGLFFDIEVNSTTGDVYLVANGNIYVLRDRASTFVPLALTSNITARDVTVNSYTGDVWVTDSAINVVWRQAEGRGGFLMVGTYDGSVVGGLAVNTDTGDVLFSNQGNENLRKLTGSLSTPAINWYTKT